MALTDWLSKALRATKGLFGSKSSNSQFALGQAKPGALSGADTPKSSKSSIAFEKRKVN